MQRTKSQDISTFAALKKLLWAFTRLILKIRWNSGFYEVSCCVIEHIIPTSFHLSKLPLSVCHTKKNTFQEPEGLCQVPRSIVLDLFWYLISHLLWVILEKQLSKNKQKQNQHFINCTTWWRRAAVCVASGIMPGVRATNPGKSSALSI